MPKEKNSTDISRSLPDGSRNVQKADIKHEESAADTGSAKSKKTGKEDLAFFVCFTVERRHYALPLENVDRVLRMAALLQVPVLDLRRRLGLKHSMYDAILSLCDGYEIVPLRNIILETDVGACSDRIVSPKWEGDY